MEKIAGTEATFPRFARGSATAGLVVCSAIAMLVSVAVRADDTDAARAGRQLAASCATCHGTNGKGQGAMPVLAGMPKNYFLEQMRAFASGERQATIMHQLGKGYSKEQIEQLADYFSSRER